MVSATAQQLLSQVQSLVTPLSALTVDSNASAQAQVTQNQDYPNRPYNPPLSFLYTDTLSTLLAEISNSNYIYAGQITRPGTLLMPARTAYEPHHVFVSRTGSYAYRFIYIPLRLLANGPQILSIPTWTYDGSSISTGTSYNTGTMFASDANSWPVTHGIYCQDYYHPLVFGLHFTGNAVDIAGGTPLWEYQDRLGWLGDRGTLYLDIYQPLGMRFPLGIPIGGQLQPDPSYNSGELYLPSSGSYDLIGYYQGYMTNDTYSQTTYYLYQYPGGVFLSSAAPIPIQINTVWNQSYTIWNTSQWQWGNNTYNPLSSVISSLSGSEASAITRQSVIQTWTEVR